MRFPRLWSRRGNESPDAELLGRLGGWRTEVDVRIRELRQRLALAQTPPLHHDPGPTIDETVETTIDATRVTVHIKRDPDMPVELPAERRDQHIRAINEALADAQTAITSPSSFGSWFAGNAVTMAWESAHAAEGELVAIESDDTVRSTLPRLLAWIQEVMGKGSLRDRYEKQLGAFIDGSTPLDRTVVRQAHQDVLVANNERHASLRAFRNQVLASSAMLALLLATLAVWYAINPHLISLCATGDTKHPAVSCLSGNKPKPGDVAQILLVGSIAGLLSIAFGLGSLTTAPSRYNVRGPQTLLKPIAGAATAFLGVLLVQSHLIIAPSQAQSQTLLLGYAAVFGFSQQLLTQFVDKRGSKLLGTDTSATNTS